MASKQTDSTDDTEDQDKFPEDEIDLMEEDSEALHQIKTIFEKKPKKVAVFTHRGPDPDAIGSMMSIQWLLKRACGADCHLFYDGSISHPQNQTMVNLLDPGLKKVSFYEESGPYDMHVLVDTVPDNSGVGEKKIDFDLVIDHHRESPKSSFKGVYINLKAGSCCATIYELISQYGLSFEADNENDVSVATALAVGIASDTEMMCSIDTTKYETSVWAEILDYRNPSLLAQIINFEIPKIWVEKKASAVGNVKVSDGVAVFGLGIIDKKHRDLIADMADDLRKWEDVNTAVVYAIIDGKRIEGSVRSVNAALTISAVCKELGSAKGGSGGGKLGKGAYSYELGGGSIDDSDPDDIKFKLQTALNDREKLRIERQLKK